MRRASKTHRMLLVALLCVLHASGMRPPVAMARTVVTPWSPGTGVQQLVYGASSPFDVEQALGRPPDKVVHAGQMFPVIDNHYYYDESGSGAATLFVFENGFLAGLHYMSPNLQLVDFTFCLLDNNDRRLNYPLLNGYRRYYPYFNFVNYGY